MNSEQKDNQNTSIQITGNIGPGAVVGSGKVMATNIAGGNIDTSSTDCSEVEEIFNKFAVYVQTHPDNTNIDKDEILEALQLLRDEVVASPVKEGLITRRLRNLQRMAPDIWEVVVATLSNPIKGVSTVIAKIAAKAKTEAE